jgi:microcystin-dependent protein
MELYNNADGAFYLSGFYSSPFNVPFLGGMDYWDTVAPNGAFIFLMGQAIPRTVYAKAFARWGTKCSAGDRATTFNVPDKTGRVSAMMEATAIRLTSAAGGFDGGTFEAVGGARTQTLLTANLPPYTPTSSVSQVTGTAPVQGGGGGAAGSAILGALGFGTNTTTLQAMPLALSAQTISINPQGGISTPVRTVQPTIVCNYILRII